VALWLLAALAACGDSGEPGANGASDITGVVTKVSSPELGQVESFEIRSRGRTTEIFIDPAVTYSFPPAHLSDHLASAEPVRVEVERRDGRLFARAMEDA
jgi:hypothetical protein